MEPVVFDPESITNPRGRNGLSSFESYYQRLLYKELIYPPYLWDPLDTWYDKQYYGKVDRVQNTIVVDETKLRAVEVGAVPNILALDCVAEAFDALAVHMRSAVQMSACDPAGNSDITKLTAHVGYSNPRTVYAEYLNTAYQAFEQATPRYTDKIIDFRSFVEVFVPYLKKVSSFIPVTMTNYLLTNTINNFSSGLTIAIANAPYDNDHHKYANFITDPNYAFYVRAAKKFGFLVNKNAPWLLTFDLFSDAALHTIEKYGSAEAPLNENTFFPFYYTPTYLYDISILEQFMANSYRSYVEKNEYYQKRIYKKTSCATYKVENHLRAPLGPGIPTSVLTPKFMANLYLSLRSLEADSPVQITDKLRREMEAIYFASPNPLLTPMENVAHYINLIYRDYIYSRDYPLLNTNVFLNLDNQIRTGKIATVGSIIQQLY
jgi:hypothetical protein